VKKKTPQIQLQDLIDDIRREFKQWHSIYNNGCNDPFYSDGTNLNLVHNHIYYDKNEMLAICSEYKINLPEEYYQPTPEVSNDYFANPKSDRAKRIQRDDGVRLSNNTTKVAINDNQLVLF
jgi:hypothetical protein